MGAQFFLTESDIGVNRAIAAHSRIQELNPLAKVNCISNSIIGKDASFFKEFTVVSVSGCSCSLEEQMRVDELCRELGCAFYSTDTIGFFGQIFVDLGVEHTYVKTDGRGNSIKGKPPVKTFYPSLRETVESANWAELHEKSRWGLPPAFYAMQAWKWYKEEKKERKFCREFCEILLENYFKKKVCQRLYVVGSFGASQRLHNCR